MRVHHFAVLLLLTSGSLGCGAGWPLTLPRFGRSEPPSVANTYGPAMNMPGTPAKPSFWRQPLEWLTAGGGESPAPTPPGVITPDDPLSLRNTPQKVSPDLYVKAAQLYESNGNLERAASQYQLALKVAPNDAGVMVGYARLLDRQGNFEEALAWYGQAAEQQPDNPSIRNDLGLCLARQGRFNESARELEYATRLRPQETLYRNNLAKVLIELDQPQDALQHLLAVHPPAVAHYNIGFLLYQKQQTQLAGEHFMRALELDRSFVKAERMLQLIHPQQRPSVASGAPSEPAAPGEPRAAALPRMLPPVH